MEYCLFETALGTFGLGWTRNGVARVALPGADIALVEKRMQKGGGVEADPPPEFEAIADRIIAYASGEREDFSDVEIDMAGIPTFKRSVYIAARRIGYGGSTTYGEIARRLGDPDAMRSVGSALAENPIPLIIPCHRVVAPTGSDGLSMPAGVDVKLAMLRLEGASPKAQYSYNY